MVQVGDSGRGGSLQGTRVVQVSDSGRGGVSPTAVQVSGDVDGGVSSKSDDPRISIPIVATSGDSSESEPDEVVQAAGPRPAPPTPPREVQLLPGRSLHSSRWQPRLLGKLAEARTLAASSLGSLALGLVAYPSGRLGIRNANCGGIPLLALVNSFLTDVLAMAGLAFNWTSVHLVFGTGSDWRSGCDWPGAAIALAVGPLATATFEGRGLDGEILKMDACSGPVLFDPTLDFRVLASGSVNVVIIAFQD